MQADRKKWLTLAAFAAVYLVWGSTYLAIRIGLQSMPPLLMAGSRFLVAGTILAGWSLLRGAPLPTRGQWLRAGVAGLLMLVSGNGCVTWAEQFVPSGIAALLVASEPFWLVLIAWGFFGGTRPGFRTWLGLASGLLGVALLVSPEGGDRGGMMFFGSVAIIFAAFTWAIGSLFLRSADLPASAPLATGMQMWTGGGILTILGLLSGERVNPATISTPSLLAWLYLIVFGSIIAFSAYGFLITATTPARLSTYAYVNPVVAVLLGRLIGHEPIPPAAWLAMVIIVASVALVTTGEREREAEGEAGSEAEEAAKAIHPSSAQLALDKPA